MGEGFNVSIYFMLSMLLLVPLGFAFAIRRAYRRAEERGGADAGA